MMRWSWGHDAVVMGSWRHDAGIIPDDPRIMGQIGGMMGALLRIHTKVYQVVEKYNH